jgi:hypothetical protein
MPQLPDNPSGSEAPEALIADLRRLAGRPESLPMFDASSVASAHFAKRRRLRLAAVVGAMGAVAAAIVVAVVIPGNVRTSPRSPLAVREDVNTDGRVDMLDAYMIAKAWAGDAAEPTWDFTGDGRVDGDDVKAVAGIAVRLPADGGRL